MKIPKQNLRTPGPTPLPQEVIDVMAQPMINHRGPEFKEMIERCTENLKQVFMTQNRMYILSSSGTGTLEAAVVNTLSPGDKVLAVSIGYFGDRFSEVAQIYGADVVRMDVEMGFAADPDAIRKALNEDHHISTVLVTHNETSTGVTNDIETISKVVKGEFGKLFIVDAISSMGCVPLPTDLWNVDVVCTASQKGLMVPPGLAFISMSDEAWVARERASMPRYYFDLERAQSYLERGQTPWTPSVSIFYGLDEALRMLLDEGMGNVFERHRHIAEYTRSGLKALGLEMLAAPSHASDTVTSVKAPDGVDVGQLSSKMLQEHSVVLAGGQGTLTGKIFRVGHLGRVPESDIDEVLSALKITLEQLGFQPAAAA